MIPDIQGALRLYDVALEYASKEGFLGEVVWQREAELSGFNESELLCEAAWVVLCSGFREKTVRQLFGYISLCFCDWESAGTIVAAGPSCVNAAMAAFRNEKKLNAIAQSALMIKTEGFDLFKASVISNPIQTLRRLPYIGPVTAFHLAKNLGFNSAKPDRHLVRVSEHFGFPDSQELCAAIAAVTGEPAKVVDLVVWRFMASGPSRARLLHA